MNQLKKQMIRIIIFKTKHKPFFHQYNLNFFILFDELANSSIVLFNFSSMVICLGAAFKLF